jgi:hypothetical protein
VRQQLTPAAIMLLFGGLVVFWVGVATLVRLHNRRRNRVAQGATEARG